MPLYNTIPIDTETNLYLWKITEDFTTLLNAVSLKKDSLERLKEMKSESHQKGFLAVRMLLQNINYTDFDLVYDKSGKPNLQNGKSISISHSHLFSALVVSNVAVGLDIEQLKTKTLKIAPRFMDVSHLTNLSQEEKIKKATVVWGIKESIFKLKNEKGISFPNHIFEEDFAFEDKTTKATLQFNQKEDRFKVVFDSVEDYIFVCAFENNK